MVKLVKDQSSVDLSSHGLQSLQGSAFEFLVLLTDQLLGLGEIAQRLLSFVEYDQIRKLFGLTKRKRLSIVTILHGVNFVGLVKAGVIFIQSKNWVRLI